MADGPDDDELREAARNRGLRLIKSRRRKAGVGDYGKFGLADLKGQALFGIDPEGTLTASAQDVASYLRKGAASTWARSAEVTPTNPKPDLSRKRVADAPAAKPKQARGATPRPHAAPARAKPPRSPASRRSKGTDKRAAQESPIPPARQLVFRQARKGDAAAIAKLSKLAGGDVDDGQIEARIVTALRARQPLLVAEQAGVIAVLHGLVLTAVHHAPVGRITLIVVAEGERRKGIGGRLLDEATAAFARAGCSRIEAMSEIAVRNANGFFRSTGFVQASYRFIPDI
jgi:N-acetylglutamate synthase-like GNAT family acetyltransferase